MALGKSNRPCARPRAASAISVDSVSSLMAVGQNDMRDARRLLGLLGDSGRRTLVEHLALRPTRPENDLSGLLGMNLANVYHRLRSLRYNHVVYSDIDHVYRVYPAPLRLMGQYFDVLAVASSMGGQDKRGQANVR